MSELADRQARRLAEGQTMRLALHIEGVQTPPLPQGPSLGVPLAGKGAIIRTPHNIDRCSVYRPNHHVLLGLFLQREGVEGGNWQLTTTLTFKYVAMELCSYVLVLNHSQRGGKGKIGDLKHIFKWSVEG